MPERVLVAMSGGVDSSVAAALLKEQGLDLVGVTFHLWDASGDQKVGRCCAPEDREDARRVCDHLGVPHYVIDERESFQREVVSPFVKANRSGLTPSPCVACNRTVKLARLLELAERWGAGRIATGHYARTIVRGPRDIRLLRGADRAKDQSYFLFGTPLPALERLMFPLGAMVKDEARQHGRRLGLLNWGKPDSQQLCFVPDGDVAGFVKTRSGTESEGSVTDAQGRVLARHQGISRFTVGQRRGLGLGGGTARYVLRIAPETRDVVVGSEQELYARSLRAAQAQWIRRPVGPFFGAVRVRYRHEPAAARITPTESGFRAEFEVAQRAIAPGQAAVIYDQEDVLGGGVIQPEGA